MVSVAERARLSNVASNRTAERNALNRNSALEAAYVAHRELVADYKQLFADGMISLQDYLSLIETSLDVYSIVIESLGWEHDGD